MVDTGFLCEIKIGIVLKDLLYYVNSSMLLMTRSMNGPIALGTILVNSSIIPTWKQDKYQETWKDLNEIIKTKCVFVIQLNMLKWKAAA